MGKNEVWCGSDKEGQKSGDNAKHFGEGIPIFNYGVDSTHPNKLANLDRVLVLNRIGTLIT